MQEIEVKIGEDKIRLGVETAINELFKSSYSNPIQKILEDSIKQQQGKIKEIVDSIIVDAIGNPEFRARMAEIVLQKIVGAALGKP